MRSTWTDCNLKTFKLITGEFGGMVRNGTETEIWEYNI